MEKRLIIVIMAWLLDLWLGDPYHWPHPVKVIGKLIGYTEKIIRQRLPKSKLGEQVGGALLVLIMLGIPLGTTALLLAVLDYINIYLSILVQGWICYQLLALKSLKVESMKVFDALKNGTIEEARKAVGMIVGRDTSQLSPDGIVKAAVETVAENTSDGVIAPLLYIACFGIFGGLFYKAVNTMDSMVGYQNEKYQYFGTAAARLDDLCNLIPSRLSAVFMILASWILKFDTKHAWMIYKRDRRNHKSPNSAQTEAVCAGALGIQLAGDAYYFGKLHQKPTIGDKVRPVEIDDIKKANRLLDITAALEMIFIVIIFLFLFALPL